MRSVNIVVTGFMGTGKTTVGRLVAGLTGLRFIDADDEIIAAAGMTIPEIFARDGEAEFRRIESEVCGKLAAQSGLVIATGGGMLVNDDNRRTMQATGLVVCLNATSDELEARLVVFERANRPLLRGDWRSLLESRRAAYAEMPYQIDTTGKTPEQVAREVAALWRNASQ